MAYMTNDLLVSPSLDSVFQIVGEGTYHWAWPPSITQVDIWGIGGSLSPNYATSITDWGPSATIIRQPGETELIFYNAYAATSDTGVAWFGDSDDAGEKPNGGFGTPIPSRFDFATRRTGGGAAAAMYRGSGQLAIMAGGLGGTTYLLPDEGVGVQTFSDGTQLTFVDQPRPSWSEPPCVIPSGPGPVVAGVVGGESAGAGINLTHPDGEGNTFYIGGGGGGWGGGRSGVVFGGDISYTAIGSRQGAHYLAENFQTPDPLTGILSRNPYYGMSDLEWPHGVPGGWTLRHDRVQSPCTTWAVGRLPFATECDDDGGGTTT